MSDLSADNPDRPGDDDHAAHHIRVDGDLRVARDFNVSGEFVGHDKVVHGYSAEQVGRLIADLAVQYQPRPFDGRCPYPGLESFRESEADLFFGREPLVAELVQRVRSSSALVITGPSGNGKSSLVHAGLIPALKSAAARNSGRFASTTPGREPLQALGRALAGLMGSLEAEDDFGRHALSDDTRLARWLKTAQAVYPGEQAVLVLDQFEEIFAQATSEAERRAFIAQLSTATEQAAPFFRLILVLRSDFIGACARYPQLNTLLSASLIQIGDLGPGDLLRAVSVPALRVGLRLDPELVSRIITDVRDEPGALPLMQFALRDLFEAERGPDGVPSLTLEAYLRRGGLHEALRRHADAVYAALTPEQQVLAREILSGLASLGLGDGAPLTRHTARLSELPGPLEVATEVVGKLAAGRLLRVEGGDVARANVALSVGTATLAHEKLLEAWPLLTNLIAERRELIRLRSAVIADAANWNEHGRDESYLYAGARLAQYLELTQSIQLKVPDPANAFLEAARELERSRAEAAEATRNADLNRERRVASQLRTRNRWITVAALLAVVATATTLWYAVTAQTQAQTSLALALAAEARHTLDALPDQTDQAALLAVESLRRSPSFDATQTLAQALYWLPIERARFSHNSWVSQVAFSPNGAWVVSGSDDGTARVWDAATGQERARMTHDGSVTSVAFSPNGAWIVSGSGDGTARVWDAATGQERARMTHDDFVSAIAYSPDGAWIVSGSGDDTARVWDAATGQERAGMTHDGSVTSVAFSPDGAWVVSGSGDGTARVWDATTGQERARMTHDVRPFGATAVAFSPDGAWVVSGRGDGITLVWDAATGQERARMIYSAVPYEGTAVAFSSDGAFVVSGGADGTTWVWDAATGKQRAHFFFSNLSSRVTAVAFSPDSARIVSGSDDGTAQVWELATGPERARMTQDSKVNEVAFSPNGAWVVSGSDDGTARVWDAATGQERARMSHDDSVNQVAFSPDGAWVVSGSDDGTARVWNAVTGQERARMSHGNAVYAVAFSSDGAWVVSGGGDETVRVWDAATGHERTHMNLDSDVVALAFSPDNSWVVSGSMDSTARVWDAATGHERVRISHESFLYGRTVVAFSPDGAWVVSGGGDGTARVWNAATGQERARMTHGVGISGDIWYVHSVAFSPDGAWVASGGEDGTAWVWNAATGQERAHMTHVGWEGHEVSLRTDVGRVSDLAFSPDGAWVVSGGEDGNIRVWNAATGQERARMAVDSYVTAVAFSPDGAWIVSGSTDGIARTWIWRDTELIPLACERIGRNLTQEEWQRFLPGQPYRKTCPNTQ